MGPLIVGGETIVLRDQAGRQHQVTVNADGTVSVGDVVMTLETSPDGSVRIARARNALLWAIASEEAIWVFDNGTVHTFEVEQGSSRRRAAAHHGSLMAPMPATVRSVAVAPGDAIRRGDVLLVLEAMKMELPIRAAADGRVSAIHCREGELVQPGVSLIELED